MKTRNPGLVATTGCCVAILASCAELEPLAEYRPVVDPARTDMTAFETDLGACRQIAIALQEDYRERQAAQAGANLMAGLLVGAMTGAVVGSGTGDQGRFVAAGALSGAAAGASTTDYSYDLVQFGPRRVVDRCMADRGHSILSDIGRG